MPWYAHWRIVLTSCLLSHRCLRDGGGVSSAPVVDIGLVLAWTRAVTTGGGDIAIVSRAPGSVCQADDAEDGPGAAAVVEDSGWSRIFTPMPHVCVFSSQQDWLDFIVARWPDFDPDADSVSPPGDGATDDAAWGKDPDIEGALEGTATDQVRAMARVLHHLLSRIQPHVQGEVQAVLHRPENVFFSSDRNRGERRYVGMHVRETEGRKYAKFTVTETLDCFEKASKYLEDLDMFAGGYIRASEIVGICLVSEDDTALPEAKKIVRRYFRNVESENIVHVSAASAYSSLGSSGGISKEVSHATALAGALAEMQLMAKADVFVGVASGAFDRLVFLMRDILLLERRTSLSMERGHQFPGLPLPSRRGRGR